MRCNAAFLSLPLAFLSSPLAFRTGASEHGHLEAGRRRSASRQTEGKFTGLSRNGYDYDISYDHFGRANVSGPVVFVMHGRMMNRDQMHTVGRELGCRGYNAILFDHRSHGSRKTREDGTYRDGCPDWGAGNMNYASEMYEIMQISSSEIGYMMQHLDQLPGVASDTEVGIFGESMGAHTAEYAFVHNPNVALQGSFVGMGDYLQYFTRKYAAESARFRSKHSWRELFPATLEASAKANDAVNNLEKFKERPFMVMNGGADKAIPEDINRQMVQKLRAAGYYSGTDSDKLQNFTVSGGTHQASTQWSWQSRDNMYTFIEKHLPVAKSTGKLTDGATYRIADTSLFRMLYDNDQGYAHAASDSCWDFQWQWTLKENDGLYQFQNAQSSKYLCASSTEMNWLDGHALFEGIMEENGRSARCSWQVSKVGRAYQIVNNFYKGKLMRHNHLKSRLGNQFYQLVIVKDATDIEPDGADIFNTHGDLFTFERLA